MGACVVGRGTTHWLLLLQLHTSLVSYCRLLPFQQSHHTRLWVLEWYQVTAKVSAKAKLFQRLQGIRNAAARLITGTGHREHISPVLRRLHWLPVRQRVEFKLALLIHKSLLCQLPSYLADDCQLIANSSRRTLRSSDTATFVVPRTNSTFGDRSLLLPMQGFGTAFQPLNVSNGHWRHFGLFETAAHLWLCLRRAGYKFSDIHTYIHTSMLAVIIVVKSLTALSIHRSRVLIRCPFSLPAHKRDTNFARFSVAGMGVGLYAGRLIHEYIRQIILGLITSDIDSSQCSSHVFYRKWHHHHDTFHYAY